MYAREQVILAEWLGQIANNARLERARPHTVIWVGGNQDGGNRCARSNQATMHLKPAHVRHLHIGDDASCTAQTIRFQKILGSFESLRSEPKCPHQTLNRIARRIIIVNDQNQRLFRQFSLPYQPYLRHHSTRPKCANLS
jgi:hypothetical protein